MSALNLLKQIEGPDDIKRLPGSEIKSLCEEIRSFLIMNISHTGGHLAANLGMVELKPVPRQTHNTEEKTV